MASTLPRRVVLLSFRFLSFPRVTTRGSGAAACAVIIMCVAGSAGTRAAIIMAVCVAGSAGTRAAIIMAVCVASTRVST